MYEQGVDPNWEYYLETGEDPTDGELSEDESAEMDEDSNALGISEFDMCVLDAYETIMRGCTLRYALRKNGLTEKEYMDNIDRVLKEN